MPCRPPPCCMTSGSWRFPSHIVSKPAADAGRIREMRFIRLGGELRFWNGSLSLPVVPSYVRTTRSSTDRLSTGLRGTQIPIGARILRRSIFWTPGFGSAVSGALPLKERWRTGDESEVF